MNKNEVWYIVPSTCPLQSTAFQLILMSFTLGYRRGRFSDFHALLHIQKLSCRIPTLSIKPGHEDSYFSLIFKCWKNVKSDFLGPVMMRKHFCHSLKNSHFKMHAWPVIKNWGQLWKRSNIILKSRFRNFMLHGSPALHAIQVKTKIKCILKIIRLNREADHDLISYL